MVARYFLLILRWIRKIPTFVCKNTNPKVTESLAFHTKSNTGQIGGTNVNRFIVFCECIQTFGKTVKKTEHIPKPKTEK